MTTDSRMPRPAMSYSSFQVVEAWTHLLIPLLNPTTLEKITELVSSELDEMAKELHGEYAAETAQDIAAFGYSVLKEEFWHTHLGRQCMAVLWQDDDDEPFTFRQAAALMGVAVATVQREIARGHLSRLGSAVSRASVGQWILARDAVTNDS